MVLVVRSHPGANDVCFRHYPYWKRIGFSRIIGVGTDDNGCKFPEGMESANIGKSSYCNINAITRILDIIKFFLDQPDWDSMALSEYDVLILKPLPEPIENKLYACVAGYEQKGLLCKEFLTAPYVANRSTWKHILEGGIECLHSKETEQGHTDCFISWVIEKHKIFYNQAFDVFVGPGANIETNEEINKVKKAMIEGRETFYNHLGYDRPKDPGISAIHGIKKEDVLRRCF